MQFGNDLLTTHSWTLAGLIVLIASALGGLAAFVANLLKSWETVRNLNNDKRKPRSAESKPVEVKVAFDLKTLGIPPPFAAPTARTVRNMAIGGVAGATVADLAAAQSNDSAPQEGARADVNHGVDVASGHGSPDADAHQVVADHAHHWWDFIVNIFS